MDDYRVPWGTVLISRFRFGGLFRLSPVVLVAVACEFQFAALSDTEVAFGLHQLFSSGC